MPAPLTRDDLKTRQGRKRARHELMLGDHGILRLLYDNSHEISPGKLWRSYQPSPEKLAKWQAKGVKTIVNLRGDNPSGYYFLEQEACEKLGLNFVTFRVFSREAPSIDALYGARELFEKIEYPALIHCKSGADRAGVMAVLYLFFHEGRPLDEALEQLSFRYGHVKQGKTGVIDFAFERYLDFAKATGKDLASVDDFFAWVNSEYDPVALKKEFLGSWWGNFLTERVLRRE